MAQLRILAEGGVNLGARRYAATKAIVLSTVATAFPVFDIPVFWPILLVYFIVLFVITMRRQIGHMRKYKYLPFDLGRKSTYGNGGGLGGLGTGSSANR